MGRLVVFERAGGVIAAAAVVGFLSACSGSHGFEAESPEHGTVLGNLLAFNSPDPPSPAKPYVADEKPTCPDIEVLDGTSASRVYGAGEQSNANVRYQFSLGDIVRECSHVGDQLVLKVGVQGRALLGPIGSAGTFSAPVRVAIRSETTDKAVASKLYPVPVTVAAGEAGAPFSLVTDPISVPSVSSKANSDYTIVVGFDSKGDAGVKASPAPHRKRRG